jgi:phosphinothricin acetyltransferase
MATVVRPAGEDDLAAITDIYNHYVVHTPITFDVEPVGVEARRPWFREHSAGGRHRLFVAHDESGGILGYAGTGRFRPKAAYDTTVEITIYCRDGVQRRGIGSRLYAALFASLRGEDINRIVAGVALPNDASVAFHERFGFQRIGIFSENGRKFGRFWDVLWLERPLTVD